MRNGWGNENSCELRKGRGVMRDSRRRWVKLLVPACLIAASLPFLFGCGSGQRVKIGAVVSTSGSSGEEAVEGIEVMKGLEMAVDGINAAGGVGGRKIEVIHEDAQADPQRAVESFRRIEEEHEPLFYISTLSSVSLALAPSAEREQVVLMATVATAPELTENRRWVYRFWPTPDKEAVPIVRLFVQLGLSRLGVLYLDDAYGRSMFEEIRAEFVRKGGRVSGAAYDVNTTDFSGRIGELDGEPALYFVGYPFHVARIVRQARRLGYEGVMANNNTIAFPSISALPEAEGIYTAVPIVYNENYLFAREFRDEYRRRYSSEFNHYAPVAYDWLRLLVSLMEDREISRESVKEVVDGGFMYSGVFGDLDVRPGEHNISFPLFPARIVDGTVRYR